MHFLVTGGGGFIGSYLAETLLLDDLTVVDDLSTGSLGESTSLLNLINILSSYFPSWNESIDFASARPGDILHSQADNSKAKSLLGFIPKWSVELGIRSLDRVPRLMGATV